MPVSYPPAPASLAGDLLTIHRLLQSPALIRRRLQTLSDMRFVADQILTQRFRTTGGAVLYEVSEPLFNEREIEAVAPGAEYPRDTPGTGEAATAAVSKWGQAVYLSDEAIKRNLYGGSEVDRALRKVVNTVIRKVDRVTIAAVASAVTQTQGASAGWEGSSATMLRDIELAKAQVADLDMGYMTDTIMMSTHTLEVAEAMCDRIGIIQSGRIRAHGTMADLQKHAAGGGSGLEDIFLKLTGDNAARELVDVLDA